MTSRSKDKWRLTFTGLGGCNARLHNDNDNDVDVDGDGDGGGGYHDGDPAGLGSSIAFLLLNCDRQGHKHLTKFNF